MATRLLFVLLFFGQFGMIATANPLHGLDDYAVLGINRGEIEKMSPQDRENEISRAYRRLAVRYHPDRPEIQGMPKEERYNLFKRINEAADNLRGNKKPSTPQENTAKAANRNSGFDFENIFNQRANAGYRVQRQLEEEVSYNSSRHNIFRVSRVNAIFDAL